ncbi:hypothetical protein D3C72_2495540 [compost metagenome]
MQRVPRKFSSVSFRRCSMVPMAPSRIRMRSRAALASEARTSFQSGIWASLDWLIAIYLGSLSFQVT